MTTVKRSGYGRRRKFSFCRAWPATLLLPMEKRTAEELLKEKDTALLQREKKFRALVQEGSDMITIIDSEGTTHFASDSVFSVLG